MYFSQCVLFVFFNLYSITSSDAWKASTLLHVVLVVRCKTTLRYIYAKPPVLWPIPVCQKSADKHNLILKAVRNQIRMDPAFISDPVGLKWPTIEKNEEISGFEVLDVLFLRAEGFSCSSNVWRPRDK